MSHLLAQKKRQLQMQRQQQIGGTAPMAIQNRKQQQQQPHFQKIRQQQQQQQQIPKQMGNRYPNTKIYPQHSQKQYNMNQQQQSEPYRIGQQKQQPTPYHHAPPMQHYQNTQQQQQQYTRNTRGGAIPRQGWHGSGGRNGRQQHQQGGGNGKSPTRRHGGRSPTSTMRHGGRRGPPGGRGENMMRKRKRNDTTRGMTRGRPTNQRFVPREKIPSVDEVLDAKYPLFHTFFDKHKLEEEDPERLEKILQKPTKVPKLTPDAAVQDMIKFFKSKDQKFKEYQDLQQKVISYFDQKKRQHKNKPYKKNREKMKDTTNQVTNMEDLPAAERQYLMFQKQQTTTKKRTPSHQPSPRHYQQQQPSPRHYQQSKSPRHYQQQQGHTTEQQQQREPQRQSNQIGGTRQYKFDTMQQTTENAPFVGTCLKIEKAYFRQDSTPKPSEVRPLIVLKKALKNLKKKYIHAERDYEWVSSQLKSIRQDITIQRIHEAFTVNVYESHARIALRENDMDEYRRCQNKLYELYGKGLPGNDDEFMAYRMVFGTLSDASTKIASGYEDTIRYLERKPELKKSPIIQYAERLVESYQQHNYFDLLTRNANGKELKQFPSLLLHFANKLRLRYLKMLCQQAKPNMMDVHDIKKKLGYDRFQAHLDQLQLQNLKGTTKEQRAYQQFVKWATPYVTFLHQEKVVTTNLEQYDQLQLDSEASYKKLQSYAHQTSVSGAGRWMDQTKS